MASLGAEEIGSIARSVFRKENRTVVTLVSTAAAPPPAPPAEPCAAPPDPILMPGPAEPNVAVRVAFRAGSVDDPPGLEGITALTARAMAEGATESHTLQELNTLLEPTAASLRVDVDKEVTTFSGRVSREQAGLFVSLLMERLLEPKFEPADVERTRRAALDDIRSRLRNNDDESLGKETLSLLLYEGHPYGHYTGGSIAGLERITAEDMRSHRARVFTADRVTIGLAGGYPAELERKLAGLPAALPCPASSAAPAASPTPNGFPETAPAPSPDRPASAGRAAEGNGGKPAGDSAGVTASVVAGNGPGGVPADMSRPGAPSVPPPPSLHVANSRLVIVEKPTGSTAISLGFALDVKRGDPDFPALALAVSWLGEHRQFVGRLQNRMRSLRGLNYGDYAYTEFFRQDGGSVYPAAGCPRSQQYFSIWIRPVETSNGPFALREAVYELRRLLVEGIPEADFARIRDYVIGYSRLKEQTFDRRLGMAFDDRFYGLRDGANALRAAWSRLTREEVNDAIRRRWRASGLTMVMVVRDGEAVRRELLSGAPSTITYASPMPAAVREEDAVIGSLDLGLVPGQITVIRASSLFEQ